MPETDDLWIRLKKENDPAAKEELVEKYLPLVRHIATRILKKLRAGADLDDLISDGIFGLMRAIDNFDLSRGYKFETYATPVVRGAIYNGLRSLDWVPERTRGKARAVQRTTDQFYKEHGRTPTSDELAEEMKISANEVYDLIANLGCIYILSLDQPLASFEGDDVSIMSVVENDTVCGPLAEVEFKEERAHLKKAIENLNEREQYIISKHYFEGFTFESISHDLGVSKQRISQMHARAVRRMREYLGRMIISDEALKDFVVEKHPLIPPPNWRKK
ncbi:MAG: sigma-70 family RNA polymerase sigma factor [Vulcanimicrobiota bacterium]